jgi:molybdenum cofactor cytidylyltransferase
MKLHEILRLDEPCQVAVCGAGGKTSTLWRLAESLTGQVIITTTTHLSVGQVSRVEKQIRIGPDDELSQVDWRSLPRLASITGVCVDGDRLSGLSHSQMTTLLSAAKEWGISVLVEADGARSLPLKAPAAHEPVIPAEIETVIVLAGLSAVSKGLNESTVFRAAEFSHLTGVEMEGNISPEAVAALTNHPDGGLKGIPDKARRVLILNQLDMLDDPVRAMRIANLCEDTYESIIIGSMGTAQSQPHVAARVERVACIILAAGGSTRLSGLPKGALDFDGSPLVLRAVRTAVEAGMDPVVVVSGYGSAELEKILGSDHPYPIAYNPDWQEGQATSIRAGLQYLQEGASGNFNAVIFMLVDQPFVTPELLNKLVELHQTQLSPIVAPLVDGTRANPVLFDRVTFSELMRLQGDMGGRAIMGYFPHSWLPWLDERVLLDIDTPEDLERCIREIR